MNQQEIYIIDSKRMLDHSIKHKQNAVTIHIGNGGDEHFKHELAKFLVSWDLMNQGSTIITEATFKHLKGRADIFELETRTAYEVLNSETIKRFDAKKEYYPHGVTVIGFKADDIISKHLKDLKWTKTK